MELTEIKSLLDAQGEKLGAAIKTYEGQLETVGSVANEAKDAVRALSEQFKSTETALTEMGQKLVAGYSTGIQHTLSPAEEFVRSEKFKSFAQGNDGSGKIRLQLAGNITSVKSTTIGGSTTVFAQQNNGIIAGGFVPVTVRNALRAIPVSTNAVNSLREASWTNSAAEASEGSAKKESDITFENYDVPIRTVAHWLKVSNQLLADAPAVVGYIETRLRDGLEQRIEAQLIGGNGTSPNISGLTDSGNYTAYTSTSTDTLTDAINRAKYTLWAAGFMPDLVIVNPADWGAMERERESAGSGQYLYGAPGVAAGMNPFGLRVILSTHVTAGYFIIGAFNSTVVLYERQGAVIEMGYQNADFTNNLVTLRAEERLGLGIERPSAILYGQFSA